VPGERGHRNGGVTTTTGAAQSKNMRGITRLMKTQKKKRLERIKEIKRGEKIPDLGVRTTAHRKGTNPGGAGNAAKTSCKTHKARNKKGSAFWEEGGGPW